MHSINYTSYILPTFIKSGQNKKAFLLSPLLLISIFLFAQQTIEISGLVTGRENQDPLPGVAVNIKGTVVGTLTNSNGAFVLRTRQKLPFILLFSSVGFAPDELEVTSISSQLKVALSTRVVLGS
jgi:hypothetical protein